jgi:hypothetical protein
MRINPSQKFCGNVEEGICFIPAGNVPIALHVGKRQKDSQPKPIMGPLHNKNDALSATEYHVHDNNVEMKVRPHRDYQDYAQRGVQSAKIENLFAEVERKIVSAVNVKSNPPLHQKAMGAVTTSPKSGLIKIQLILSLQKLQALGVSYVLLNQYFYNLLGDAGFFSSILVFDDQTLTNSNSCYASAISSVTKTKTTDYSPLGDAVEGLVEIVTAFK